MYDEISEDGMHISAVAQIAAEFGVTWPNIYRALAGPARPAKRPASRPAER